MYPKIFVTGSIGSGKSKYIQDTIKQKSYTTFYVEDLSSLEKILPQKDINGNAIAVVIEDIDGFRKTEINKILEKTIVKINNPVFVSGLEEDLLPEKIRSLFFITKIKGGDYRQMILEEKYGSDKKMCKKDDFIENVKTYMFGKNLEERKTAAYQVPLPVLLGWIVGTMNKRSVYASVMTMLSGRILFRVKEEYIYGLLLTIPPIVPTRLQYEKVL